MAIRTSRKSLGAVKQGSAPQVHPGDLPDGIPGAAVKRKFREYGLRPPDALQRFCREHGGLNPFGGPMYRLSWAPACLTWMAGQWRVNDEHGNFKYWKIDAGYAPKYPQLGERWILESWREAQMSPTEWEAVNRQLEDNGEMLGKIGPYPHEGHYECVFHFQTGDTREYVIPNQTLCEWRIQEHTRMSKKRELLLRNARDAQEAEKLQTRKEQADILSEPIDGLNSLLTPYVSLAGVDVPPATTQEVPS